MADVLRPLVAQHFGGSTHLQLESLGKGGIAEEVVPYTLKFVSMAGWLGGNGPHLDEGAVAMIHALVNDVEG